MPASVLPNSSWRALSCHRVMLGGSPACFRAELPSGCSRRRWKPSSLTACQCPQTDGKYCRGQTRHWLLSCQEEGEPLSPPSPCFSCLTGAQRAPGPAVWRPGAHTVAQSHLLRRREVRGSSPESTGHSGPSCILPVVPSLLILNLTRSGSVISYRIRVKRGRGFAQG